MRYYLFQLVLLNVRSKLMLNIVGNTDNVYYGLGQRFSTFWYLRAYCQIKFFSKIVPFIKKLFSLNIKMD